jgi:hypothetical protein
MMREYDLLMRSRVVAPNENYGMFLRAWLESKLPPDAERYLDTAFAGDDYAALGLCVSAPNEDRGVIALAAYHAGVANPGYRKIIRMVWNHDYFHLLAAVKQDRRLIRRMIKTAEFDHPFSGPLTIFRGASLENYGSFGAAPTSSHPDVGAKALVGETLPRLCSARATV